MLNQIASWIIWFPMKIVWKNMVVEIKKKLGTGVLIRQINYKNQATTYSDRTWSEDSNELNILATLTWLVLTPKGRILLTLNHWHTDINCWIIFRDLSEASRHRIKGKRESEASGMGPSQDIGLSSVPGKSDICNR